MSNNSLISNQGFMNSLKGSDSGSVSEANFSDYGPDFWDVKKTAFAYIVMVVMNAVGIERVSDQIRKIAELQKLKLELLEED